MEEWIEKYPELPTIDGELLFLRQDIQGINEMVRNSMNIRDGLKKSDYDFDVQLGLKLYEYLDTQTWFSLRVASNDGFWRYLSVCVVPDVVAQRWGKDNSDHYYSKPTRIWLRSLWWYVYLSWQGSLDSTEIVLTTKHFTTDTLLNFVERTGRKGACIEAYRKIILYYSKVSEQDFRKFSENKKEKNDDIFRVVMKLNTAKMLVMEPALCVGEEGYAKALYKDAGVEINVT